MSITVPDTPDDYPVKQPNYSIELTKNTRGYQWVVKVRGDVMNDVLDDLKVIDARLRRFYGDKTEGTN